MRLILSILLVYLDLSYPSYPILSYLILFYLILLVNKLDGLLSKLDHIQLRNLIKMAVDQNIDMTGPIRSYMNINRNCFGIWTFPGIYLYTIYSI
jgi:hypothetical protein